LHGEDGLTYFAGSQDADEEYYLLSHAERVELQAPFIDWRVYVDWNALMVSALLQASVVLDQPNYAGLAKRIWRTLITRCVRDDGSVTHSLLADGSVASAALHGQLGDQAALAKASLDLAQYDPAMADEALAVARQVLAFALRELAAEDGGFYDSPANPLAKGMLRTRIKPIFDNCAIAGALLTLSYLAEDATAHQSRELALQTLATFAEEYKRYREHGSPYALVVLRATQMPDEIMIVAEPSDALPFVRAAHAAYSPWRAVRVLDPERDAAFIAARSYPVGRLPVAFVCKGTACSAPIFSPSALAGL
jgi:uncharacterized protein YyaL (SSP411 family)